jgi:hypothetical protein
MKFRGGEFPTGTTGNFQPELTHDATLDPQDPHKAPNGVQAPGDEKPIF